MNEQTGCSQHFEGFLLAQDLLVKQTFERARQISCYFLQICIINLPI